MLKLSFKTDNAAFDGSQGRAEVARILRDVAEKIEMGASAGDCRDENGNRVGLFTLKLED